MTVIQKIEIPAYNQIIIETSDGFRYESDLSTFSGVYCYPKDLSEWKLCSIDSYGLAVVWTTRFEIHVDQIIGLATKSEGREKVG